MPPKRDKTKERAAAVPKFQLPQVNDTAGDSFDDPSKIEVTDQKNLLPQMPTVVTDSRPRSVIRLTPWQRKALGNCSKCHMHLQNK